MELTWVYLYKNDTSLRVYQISFLLSHRTTMTATYSSDPAKLTESLEFGAQIYSDASSIKKKPDAKAAVDKECEKLEKIAAWQLTKVRNEKEVIDEARNKGRKVQFASFMDLCHLKNVELELQFQKYKGWIVLRGDTVERWFRIIRSTYWTRSISITNGSRKFPGHYFEDYQDAQDKQQMQYPLFTRSKWKMHGCYWKFQSQNVQIFGYVHRNTNGQNHGPVWKTQLFLLEEICSGHPVAGLWWERQFENVFLKKN